MSRVFSVVLLLVACSKPAAPADPVWADGVTKFRANRAKAIAGPDGWMALLARVPLKNGVNTIGSEPSSRAVLPADRSPPLLGTINVEAGTLYFMTAPGSDVRVGGVPVTTMQLNDDSRGKPTVLEAGSLRMHVLRRGDAFMLRVKDREHPSLAAFKGLEWYAPDPAFHVMAKLEPSPAGTKIPILNVLGQTEAQPSPGHLVFTLGATEYRLAALQEDEPGLFVIFKDQTAGKTTYPSGRFINTPAVNAAGMVELDFNRAYSPPCAFTKFATCPLPPRENSLQTSIEAGEKYSGEKH